ncbi:MAG: hypothetical protein C0404_04305 [Verrucomicrobia bacterium]|nr:hypothetical protein [Verrucomicrobiota bacterium]
MYHQQDVAQPGKRRTFMAAFLLLAVAACIVPLLAHLLCQVLPDDDAYITFRYARNFIEGHGLVYNEGERVFGISSPLYLLWLTAVAGTTGAPIEVVAVRCNVIFYLLSALGTFLVLKHSTGRMSIAVAGLLPYAFHPGLMKLSLGGMEPFLFVSILQFSLLAAFRGRLATASVLAGLSALARPEGLLSMAGILLFVNLRDWRKIMVCLLLFAVPILAWAIPATVIFGTPVPHSIVAKSLPLYPLPEGYATGMMLQGFDRWAWATLLAGLDARLRFFVVILSGAAIMLGSLLQDSAARLRSTACLVLMVVFFAFYAITNPLLLEWYWPHLLVFLMISLLAGLGGWSAFALEAIRYRGEALKALAPAAALLWITMLVIHAWSGVTSLGGRPWNVGRDTDPTVLRTITYKEAGEFLNGLVTAPSTVAAPEIGALGYAYRGRILDVCGLVSPQAIRYLPVSGEERGSPEISAISTKLVEDLAPDYIVTMDVFAFKSIYSNRQFRVDYEQVEKLELPMELWGCRSVRVWQRKPD